MKAAKNLLHPNSSFSLGRRRRREQKTVDAMIQLYCRDHHNTSSHTICDECTALRDYALRRLTRCVFAEAKPTCARCVVHCYSRTMQERIREVMRYAGPRMLLRHPWLALHHLADGWGPSPTLQDAIHLKKQATAADSVPSNDGH